VKLGPSVFGYGGLQIPEDRIVVMTEAEAAAALRDRGGRDSITFIEYVEEEGSEALSSSEADPAST
jgi:hypothetical protein